MTPSSSPSSSVAARQGGEERNWCASDFQAAMLMADMMPYSERGKGDLATMSFCH